MHQTEMLRTASFQDKLNRTGHAKCPTCGELKRIYRRKIHSSMAAGLVVAAQLSDNGSTAVDVKDISSKLERFIHACVNPVADFAKLRHWGLIEPTAVGGVWNVTDAGLGFVAGDIKIPKLAHILDGECKKLCGPLVSIFSCLGSRFSLPELMWGE